jgi:sulfur transfer protein SufE
MKVLGVDGTLRVSIACYTSEDDVSCFIQHLETALSTLRADKSDKVELGGQDNKLEDSQSTTLILPIASKLASSKGWDNQYRQLLLASKKLRTLHIEERTSTNLLKGCESDVWLAHTSEGLRAYSESKVIRGILALLLEKAQSLDKAANRFDYFTYLEDLHLTQYFSQGRRDGVGHVIERIKQLT